MGQAIIGIHGREKVLEWKGTPPCVGDLLKHSEDFYRVTGRAFNPATGACTLDLQSVGSESGFVRRLRGDPDPERVVSEPTPAPSPPPRRRGRR